MFTDNTLEFQHRRSRREMLPYRPGVVRGNAMRKSSKRLPPYCEQTGSGIVDRDERSSLGGLQELVHFLFNVEHVIQHVPFGERLVVSLDC